MIWDILGISPTTEEEVIKTAYRTKLVNVNPEDDPEGFKQLRQAYEQACARAQEEKKGKGPLEQWIYEVEQVYADFYRRIDEEEWDDLFDNEVCTDLDTFEEARILILHFLMGHYFVPGFVWKKAWDVFEIDEDRDMLREKVSNDFIVYMEFCAQEKEYFDYQLYEGPPDADYDSYIKKLYVFRSLIDQERMEEAGSLAAEVRASEIFHPYAKAELIRYYLYAGVEDWKPLWRELQDELYDDPVLTELTGEILMEEGDFERAREQFLGVLEEKHTAVYASRKLVELYQKTGEYEGGKKICLKVLDGKFPDEKICQEMLVINEKLIEQWKDKKERQLDLAWCYYQNQNFEDCLAVLRKMKPEGDVAFDYYNLMARILLETGNFEEGLQMTKIWISNIEHLTGKEKDYDRKKKRYGFAHFIASMHCLELGMSESCEAYLKRSLELDKDWTDLLMYRERRMSSFLKRKEYEECIREANRAIEESEFFYPAYIYRQEANYHLYRIQQVIDDFYRAIEIDPVQGKPYVTAVKMLLELNLTEDVEKILEIGKHHHVEDPEFRFYLLDHAVLQEKQPESMAKLAQKMETMMPQLSEDSGPFCYRLGLIFGRLEEELPGRNYIRTALKYAQEAVENHPDVIEYEWLLADLYKKNRNFEQAVIFYKKILQKDHTLYDAWIDLGYTYDECGKTDQAIDALERAAESADRHPYVHNSLMNLYLKRFEKTRERSDFDRGLWHADRQLEIVENDYYYRERAYFYLEDMQLEPALADIIKSYEQNPEDLYALSSMGYIYCLLGEYKKAIEYYTLAEKKTETSEQQFSLYRWWGPIYERDGQFEKALSCYMRCLMVRPDSLDALEQAANIFMRRNQYAEAARYYEKVMMRKKRGKADLTIKTAKALHYAKNRLKEKKILKQVELNFGHIPEVKCQLGDYYLDEKQDLKKAYRCYMDACGYDLEKPYIRLVEVYSRMGKTEDAIKMRRLAEKKIKEIYGSIGDYFRIKGKQKYIYYHIFMMYYYNWEIDAAMQYLREMKERPMCSFCPYGFCFEELLAEARILEFQGKRETAMRLCGKILRQDQNLGQVRHLIKELGERR